jgi:arylsulfatase A-like enzyme
MIDNTQIWLYCLPMNREALLLPYDGQQALEAERPATSRLARVSAVVAGMAMIGGALTSGCSTEYQPTDSLAVEQPMGMAQPEQEVLTPKPNIVEIMVDDLDKKPMKYMTKINSLLRDQGVTLTNFQTEQSLCCPSRAVSFTGKYAHNNGVIGNEYPGGGYVAFHRKDESKALPIWLQKNGYVTSFMGKYFNEYPRPPQNPEVGVSNTFVPPGWNKWMSPVLGEPYGGFKYKLNVNGKLDATYRHKFFGDTLSSMAVSTLRNMPTNKPYFMTIRPFTPHHPYSFPKRMADKYTNVKYPHKPNFNEKDMSDKSGKRPLYGSRKIAEFNQIYRDRIRGMKVVDNMVGRIMDTLKQRGDLGNTYVIFTSDNGYMLGEHREETKYKQYRESQEVPFIIRGPGIPKGQKINTLLENIDIAPTYADIAHANIRSDIDGESMLPLLTGVIKNWPRYYTLFGRGKVPITATSSRNGMEEPQEMTITARTARNNNFIGVMSADNLKYVQYRYGDRFELYNLNGDPYELNNLFGPHGDEELQTMPADLRRKVIGMRKALALLRVCAGDNCTLPNLTPAR